VYPERTPALVTLLVLCAAAAVVFAVRRPFLRRLALRQVARRRGEAALVIGGSALGTAIIIGSLVVGDTLNFSVRQGAYTNLGPIDEIVTSPTVAQGDQAAARLQSLRTDPEVDGVLTVRGDQAAAVTGAGADRRSMSSRATSPPPSSSAGRWTAGPGWADRRRPAGRRWSIPT
jgi:putative ABC transport system permease protein